MGPSVWERRFGLLLATVIAVGAVVALVIAGVTDGEPYDMESFRLVNGALHRDALDLYGQYGQTGRIRWPYPPGFLPWVYLAGEASRNLHLDFELLIRLPSIAATGATAWFVQDFLRMKSLTKATRLGAASLVSLGPSFLIVSGYHGQIDALAILPGVIALWHWTRSEPGLSRALTAGLLIGVGGVVKTVPLLLVLALLPSVGSRREGAALLGGAVTPVALAFAPFALAGSLPSIDVLTYRGLPGVGGISLLAQPTFAVAVLGIRPVAPSGLAELVADHGSLLTYAALLGVAVVGWRSRRSPVEIATLLWLAVLVFGVNFFFQYALWGLPFFLMAGHVRGVAAAQVALGGASLIFYLRPWSTEPIAGFYAILMLGLLAAAFVSLAITSRRLLVPAERPR